MPFKSQAQRGLMHAVASGKAKKSGVSKAAAKKMVADDPGGKLPAKANSSISSTLSKAMVRNQRKNNMDVG